MTINRIATITTNIIATITINRIATTTTTTTTTTINRVAIEGCRRRLLRPPRRASSYVTLYIYRERERYYTIV